MLTSVIEKEENAIRKSVLQMGAKASTAIEKSIISYQNSDVETAQQVIKKDSEVNQLENEIESQCTNLIALQQPVAGDLREILADMSIAKELERIADYAVTISKVTLSLADMEKELEPRIFSMAKECNEMLVDVLIDYADKDAKKAETVARQDDNIDALDKLLNNDLLGKMESNPQMAKAYTYQLSIIHNLERMGDRITNIAEQVTFLSTGKVVNYD